MSPHRSKVYYQSTNAQPVISFVPNALHSPSNESQSDEDEGKSEARNIGCDEVCYPIIIDVLLLVQHLGWRWYGGHDGVECPWTATLNKGAEVFLELVQKCVTIGGQSEQREKLQQG